MKWIDTLKERLIDLLDGEPRRHPKPKIKETDTHEHRVKPEYLLAERITAEDLRDRSVSAESKSFLDQYGFENTNDLKNPTI